MADLVVVVPSRGRPKAALELAEAFQETCTADTHPSFVVDRDDPTIGEYWEIAERQLGSVTVGDHSSMVDALNKKATGFAYLEGELAPYALGFMGDDHRPRTKGWDRAYLDALRALGTGIVYGNDLLQGERLPTQCAMTSDIVRALGYMAPPNLTHLYVDNFWLDIGYQADCLRYLPNVVVEHCHPVAGKAQWDDGYVRVNSDEQYTADRVAYSDYLATSLQSDLIKVVALREAA